MARILVVDDSDSVRMTIKMMLMVAKHEMVFGVNGKDGLAILEKEGGRFDFIITDMLMPEMDGAEFMMRVREKYEGMPILAVSGGGNKMGMDEAIDIAKTLADRVLKKPFTKAELMEAVDFLEKTKKGNVA